MKKNWRKEKGKTDRKKKIPRTNKKDQINEIDEKEESEREEIEKENERYSNTSSDGTDSTNTSEEEDNIEERIHTFTELDEDYGHIQIIEEKK